VSSQRGFQRERDYKKLREADGWVCLRAPASLGAFDLVAMKAGEPTQLIEMKSTHRGPFHSFGPADRAELLEVAKRAGALAVLVWWPPRAKPVMYTPDDWP
jgi:Holliday junction resolvase